MSLVGGGGLAVLPFRRLAHTLCLGAHTGAEASELRYDCYSVLLWVAAWVLFHSAKQDKAHAPGGPGGIALATVLLFLLFLSFNTRSEYSGNRDKVIIVI